MKAFLVSLVVLVIAGCANFQFDDSQLVELTVAVMSKEIGLKASENGFVWTDDIELFYNLIMQEEGISLNLAQAAEKYISENVDPLIAPDLIKLASMIGFEFQYGELASTDDVNFKLLKSAVDGFRMAVLYKMDQ